MTHQGVLIKGNSDGITILVNEAEQFTLILEELREKFINANDFFRGASIAINPGSRLLTPEEKMALIDLCQEFELSGVEFINKPVTLKKRDALVSQGETLILKKTIRSGQRISYKGTIVVVGDINPGAEVVATGDIVVMGYLRGVVHAGADGNTEAEVLALALQPTQLRIAHCIARSPDRFSVKIKGKIELEKAYIKDGLIVIEGLED